MCKLCGTNRPPHSPPKAQPLSAQAVFRKTVKDYTGEFPCISCHKAGASYLTRNNNDNIDSYIIRKLFSKATKDKKTKVSSESVAMNMVQDNASHNITRLENISSGKVVFILAIMHSQHGIRKSFHNINDAIKERDWRIDKIKKTKKCIERYIYPVLCIKNRVSFSVVVRIKGKNKSKNFKTLKEAQAFKALMIKKRDN